MALSDEKFTVIYDDAPEVAPANLPEPTSYFDESRQKILVVDPSLKKEVLGTELPTEYNVSGADDEETGGETRPRTICGLRKKLFWAILLLAVVVIGAAVGGGVGGRIAASRSRDRNNEPLAAEASSSTMSSPARTSTSTSTATTASSGIPTPTPTGFLNNSTTGFEFQAFNGKDYRGEATDIWKTPGRIELDFNSSSYVWKPNETNCCVTFCQHVTWVGWRCGSRFQPNSSAPFDNINIGCSSEETLEASKEKCEE